MFQISMIRFWVSDRIASSVSGTLCALYKSALEIAGAVPTDDFFLVFNKLCLNQEITVALAAPKQHRGRTSSAPRTSLVHQNDAPLFSIG